MASTLGDFTLSAVAAPDDFIVGYDEAALNGERRWTVSTIANAVSGVASLGTVKSVTGTAPISVANGTTTPAISIADATTTSVGVAELATLSEVQGGIGTNTIVTPANLNTLLNTLSTNIMQTIGNYPYLEYAWVTEPNAAGQSITGDSVGSTPTVLTITDKTIDTRNLVTQPVASNQFRVPAGTYQFQLELLMGYGTFYSGDYILYLYNNTASTYIAKGKRANIAASSEVPLIGQFKLGADSDLDARILVADSCTVGRNFADGAIHVATLAGGDQRTTIKLWKVG